VLSEADSVLRLLLFPRLYPAGPVGMPPGGGGHREAGWVCCGGPAKKEERQRLSKLAEAEEFRAAAEKAHQDLLYQEELRRRATAEAEAEEVRRVTAEAEAARLFRAGYGAVAASWERKKGWLCRGSALEVSAADLRLKRLGLQAAHLRLSLSKIGHWRLGEAVAFSPALTAGSSSDERKCTLEHPTATTCIAEGVTPVVRSQRCGVCGDLYPKTCPCDNDEPEPAPVPNFLTPADSYSHEPETNATAIMAGSALDEDVLALVGAHITVMCEEAEQV
jgi:hypothetical protein